jgi:hypothetical protein
MKPIYLQELKKYYPSEFERMLGLEPDELNKTIIELQNKRILKIAMDGRYFLQFVGILFCFKKVVFCIPKYITHSNAIKTMTQLLTLFRQYSKREKLDQEEMETFGDIESHSTFNMLSVMMFLVEDYLENGLYQNDKNIYIQNGENGEIDWNKTINDQYAMINEGKPFYLDYYVKSVVNDENDFFRILHMQVLTACSSMLEETGLEEYFGYPPITFDVYDGDLGSSELILSKISSELAAQLVNRKQMVLKAIAAFISHEKMKEAYDTVEFYGTRNFEVVWEKICGFILHNQFEYAKDYIAKPVWNSVSGSGHEADTLKPDVISMFRSNRKNYFIISDAKYYKIHLTDTLLSGNPGVGDVTKQYLYQLALKKLMADKNVDRIHNVLLFPTEEDTIEYIGEVSIEFLKGLDLEDIMLVKLPVHIVFNLYITYERLNLGMFANLLNLNKNRVNLTIMSPVS